MIISIHGDNKIELIDGLKEEKINHDRTERTSVTEAERGKFAGAKVLTKLNDRDTSTTHTAPHNAVRNENSHSNTSAKSHDTSRSNGIEDFVTDHIWRRMRHLQDPVIYRYQII